MKVYRIVNVETGEFCKGGTFPRWGKNGKIWTTRGALKNFLNRQKASRYQFLKPSWQVIEYDLDAGSPVMWSAQEEADRPAKGKNKDT